MKVRNQINSFIGKTKSIHSVLKIIEGILIMQVNGVKMSIPLMIGNPGMGKTSLFQQLCLKNNWGFYSKHLGMIPIEEIGGIPQFYNISEKVIGTKWSKPEINTELEVLSKKHELVLCLFDDIHVASQSHFNLMYEMFTERALRSHKFPDNIAFAMAGNPSQKAGAKPIPSAIINRCSFIPVHLDFEDWKKKFAIPNKIHPAIISFLGNMKNNHLFHENEQVSKPWASPRSWTLFSNLITAMDVGLKNGLDKDTILFWGSGHIGETAASEFATYYKLFREVNVQEIFDEKENIRIPSDLSSCYIYMMALVDEFFNRYINSLETRKTEKINEYAKILAEAIIKCQLQMSEIAVPTFKEIVMTAEALQLKEIYDMMKKKIFSINSAEAKIICQSIVSMMHS